MLCLAFFLSFNVQVKGFFIETVLVVDAAQGNYKAHREFKELSKEERRVIKFLAMALNEMYTVKGLKYLWYLAKRNGIVPAWSAQVFRAKDRIYAARGALAAVS